MSNSNIDAHKILKGKNKMEKAKKIVTIIVNGRQNEWAEKEISYAQVVALAFENPHMDDTYLYLIDYSRAEGNKKGSLEAGETIKVKDGMVFNVSETHRS
jgi:hypothetical protein